MDINDIKSNVGEVRVWVKEGKLEGYLKFDEIGYALFRIWEGLGSDIQILKVTYNDGENDVVFDEKDIEQYLIDVDNYDPDTEYEGNGPK